MIKQRYFCIEVLYVENHFDARELKVDTALFKTSKNTVSKKWVRVYHEYIRTPVVDVHVRSENVEMKCWSQ